MPLWLAAVRRHGLARSWLASMLLAVVAFAGAALLGPGDIAAYAAVCVASGIALAADLVVPGALLGALYLAGLPAALGSTSTVQFITSGFGVLAFLLYLPGGLGELARRAGDGVAQVVDRVLGQPTDGEDGRGRSGDAPTQELEEVAR